MTDHVDKDEGKGCDETDKMWPQASLKSFRIPYVLVNGIHSSYILITC